MACVSVPLQHLEHYSMPRHHILFLDELPLKIRNPHSWPQKSLLEGKNGLSVLSVDHCAMLPVGR